jgi:hypothetical protein
MTKFSSFDQEKIKTISLKNRKSIVNVKSFAKTCAKGEGFEDFLDSLPKILAGEDFRALVKAILNAHDEEKPVIFGIGGHVIKCGLSPLLIDLMERKIITAIAMNGAGSIHDFEIALAGSTSEDVASSIKDGSFGMAKETGVMNDAINEGVSTGMGMGEILGKKLIDMKAPFNSSSVLATCAKLSLPATVHVSIGADIIHQHPNADGGSLGEASFTDFKIFTEVVSKLGGGGVYVNVGSAVMLPEVFLKAVSIANNLGNVVENFTTANLDFIQHYRPMQNVIKRPVGDTGKGYAITGHHEILIPLLYRAIIEGV